MRPEFRIILVLFLCGACTSHTPDSKSARRGDTQSATVAADSSAVEERLTSGVFDPLNADGNIPDYRSRFQIGVDQYVSGRLALTFDTISPRVKTEDTQPTRTAVDSLIVGGISRKEVWSNMCTSPDKYPGFVVGVIPNTVATPTVPHLAWLFDTVSYRIHSVPAGSISCSPLGD
jgi:hypothetical protein